MPKFQKRHYEAIAKIVREVQGDQQLALFFPRFTELSMFTGRLADVFSRDNPAFDRARFVRACHTSEDNR